MTYRSLKTVGLVAIYAFLGFGSFMAWRANRCQSELRIAQENRPIQWRPYSVRAKEAYLENGMNVFVFVKPMFAIAPELDQFDYQTLSALFGGEQFAPMVLKYKNWNEADIIDLFREVGHTKESFVVVYRPGETPLRLGAFSLKSFEVKYNL